MKNPRLIQLTLLLIAHGALAIAADGATAPSTSGGITEISVERTRCFGSCPADMLVLHADGKSEYTGDANTLMPGEFAGTFWPGEFDRLAQWLVTEGFFQMGDRDRTDIFVTDVSNVIIRVTRGGQQKSVTSYSSDRTLQAWAMANLIRSIAADIQWEPAHSGIRGQVLMKSPGDDWRAQPEENIWVRSPGKQAGRAYRSDREGRFEISLAPGTYTLSWNRYLAAPVTAVVEPERFAEADLRFDAAASRAAGQFRPPPPPPGDGLYVANSRDPKWMFSKGNADYFLGGTADLVFLDKQLISEGPGDSMFRLVLIVPYDEKRRSLDLFSLVLIVGDAMYKPLVTSDRGKESTMVGFQIPGESEAREAARYFDIPVGRFIRPDFQLSISIVPAKSSFKRGEAIIATLRIVNNSTKFVEFDNRSSRDGRGQYTFTARRDGQPLADFSFPGDRGGTAHLEYLSPGATFEDTVDLGKWFDFKEAGTYQIHGSYGLNVQDSREARLRIGLSSWMEYAEAAFTVTIE